MDQFRTFMEIFEKAVAERNSSNLTEILSSSRTYFQNISKDESENILSMLFDKDKGLLSFINNELMKATSRKGFDMAVKEAFHLLKFVMEQFSDIFEPYIIDTKDTCQLALKTKCSSYIQKAACNVFNKLIDLFKDTEIDYSDTIQTFVELFKVVDIKERSLLMFVLSTIAKYKVQTEEIHEYSNIIFRQLQNDFKIQYNKQNKSQPLEIFQMYLDILSNILEELSNDLKEMYSQELYTWIKDLSNSERYLSKTVSMRSAINLLFHHINQFHTFVYADYKFWYSLLTSLAQNKNAQCSECGHYALTRFYKMIGNTLKQKNTDESKEVFLYFKNLFEEELKKNHENNSNMLRFIVYGFSRMAAPCKRHLTNNDVRDMFSLIAHCAMPLCAREYVEQKELESICDYQEALSEIILHISDLTIDQINIILKFSILLVKKFPILPVTGQNLATSTLINTVINIGIVGDNLLEEFLYNLIHDGISWSCSHTLLVDAELERGLKNLEERPTTYKNYLPMWLQLLNPKRYKEHRQIVQQVVDSVIDTCIGIISKLNLNTKVREENVFSDVSFSQIAENMADFRTFVNIADLYVDIINKLETSLLSNTVHKFLLNIIFMSSKRPLISGFYKLVHSCFKHICTLSKDEIEAEILEVLYKYLLNVLSLIPTFSKELLNTCLSLILSTPIMYVECILNDTIPAFQIAFTVGLSDFEMACTALNALEEWTGHIESRHMSEFLREVVPYLEPYLQSGESSVEFLQDIIKTERKVIKRIILRDDENTLETFQRRVLSFLASLDSNIAMHFLYKKSSDIGATWDKKDLLQYSLIFSEAEINVPVDKILPRLILLAQNSGDRRTKITACEVLHSVVAFVLGKTSQSLALHPDRYVPVYKKLCPALLHLGCDYDEAARNIFQPLMLQLTHWLSSKFMLKSPATEYFLDSLFEGLTTDSNSSLREFSGLCLAEFTKWSIKQSDNDRRTESNIDEVISKIINFALHPSMSKRVAAAVAFNHLYTILREDEKIVTTYWLEILYCFVKSLDGCTDPSISIALSHVERVVSVKKNVFNAKHGNRRKPHEFEEATLRGAVHWLLTQCGCLDQFCRAKCMELVVKFSGDIADCDSVKTMISNYIKTHGIDTFNRIILQDMNSKIESLSSKSMLPLLRSFDFYIWLIRNNLVNVQFLFSNSNSEREIIFNCAKNFVHLVNKIKIEAANGDLIMLSKECEDLQTLQCNTIVSMFEFVHILLNFDENFIPNFFCNKDFFELLSKCIMSPQLVGFNIKNLEVAEKLPSVIENLLHSISQTTDPLLFNRVKTELAVFVEKHIRDFMDLDRIFANTDICNELKQYVRGLSFLESQNILNQLSNAKRLLDKPEDKVTCIFKALAKEQIGVIVRVNIKPLLREYLETLMELLLVRYEPSMTEVLINLIENDTMLGPDPHKIEHGIHFLNLFKNVIFRYMLKNIEKTIEVFDDMVQGNPSFLLTITEYLFLFVQRHKKELNNNIEALVDAIVTRFTIFERAVNNLEDRKQKLINIYGIAVHLKRRPTELLPLSNDFYTWILNQLPQNSDLEYKIRILQNFLVCLTDMTSNTKPELLVILRCLRNDRLAMCPNDFSLETVQALKVINCFQTLSSLLPVTKSIVVFESVISFAAGIAEQLYSEKTAEYLEKYFRSLTTAHALESIEVAYKLFMTSNTSTERFDVLQKFLLPVFEFCRIMEIRQFFERNIKEIYTIIRESSMIGSGTDIEKYIISKIGCYDLVAIMFAKIPLREIDDSQSVITRNAIDEVVTGKELLQNLYSCALNVRALKILQPEHKDITRLLHCAAYNCSIAIVSLKEDEDTYVSLFAENRKKGHLIWENIVDCEKQYNFEQTVARYPKKCRKLINIRKNSEQKKPDNQYSYIYSYDLSTCTLYEDINAYDFNETPVHNKATNVDKEERMSMMFESDALNNHECMASICGALKRMVSEGISVLPTAEDIVIPKWLKCFCNSMLHVRHNNALLFMLRIVWNMQTVFQHYAKFLLSPLMNALYIYLRRNKLNYIVVDVIFMLIDWHTVAIPSEKNEKDLAQKLWETIIQTAMVERTVNISKAVYKYNMTIIRRMLEAWQSFLKLPEILNDKMRTAPGASVYLILTCFVNGMQKDIIQRTDILEFLEKSLKDMQSNEETVLECCECFGLILKYINDDDNLTKTKNTIIDQIHSVLRQMQAKFENRQMKCIRAVCKNYPMAAMTYFEFVTANIFRVDAQGKSNCLEIFLQYIPKLNAQQIQRELTYIKFKDLLTNKVLPCEKVALRLIDALVPILPASNMLSFIELVPSYTKHKDSEYRENAYNIFMSVYKKYVADATGDTNVKELIRISREMLFNGMLDPSDELQEKILHFWTQSAQFKETCKERLLEILATHTAAAGNYFLPFALSMILDLTKKSDRYMQKMFDPLQSCSYRDYKIAVSWRTKNLGTKAPLFAPSLTSQMNQTFTQMSATIPSSSFGFSFERPSTSFQEMMLRETQEPEFEPTFADNEPIDIPLNELEYDDTFNTEKVPDPVYHKKSIRFLSSSADVSANIRQKEIKRNIRRVEMIKEETTRQRSTVKLYRSYRIGDFPDIEISHATLIEPLQQLAKRDQLICKDLTVSIVRSLLERYKHDDFAENVASSLKRIIENQNESSSTVTAVLEILLTTRIMNCSPEVIAKISRSNNLNFLGSLVVEKALIYSIVDSEPPEKRMRTEGVSNASNEWLQLTNLYESMNDVDVVLSIFQNHITDEDIQKASFAQAANNWSEAKAAYERAYKRESEVVKEHCLHGLFECLSNLCKWSEIDNHVNDRLNKNIDNIWNEPWQGWMFPWLLEALLRRLVDRDINDAFEENVTVKMQSWLTDDAKMKYIKRLFGEELSLFFLDKPLIARDFLINALDETREQWIRLHPLCIQPRVSKLQKLRIINDLNVFLSTLKTAQMPRDLNGIFKFWSNSVPSAQDAILPWDKLISYRIYCIDSTLDDKINEWKTAQNDSESVPDEEDTGIDYKLCTVTFNMRLKMIEAALNQKNKYLAKKYLYQLEEHMEKYSPDMKHQFFLIGSKIKFLNGEVETNMTKKLSNYTSSWKHCRDLLQENDLDSTTNIQVRLQISRVASKIAQLSVDNEVFRELLTKNDMILSEIQAENRDPSNIRNLLETYSLDHLRTCCDKTATNNRECYFILSKYCYDKLSRGECNVQLSKDFVRSTLKAMNYGSLEAAHYFPCLLKPEYFQDEETKSIFIDESEKIQTWLFLSWQAQLFSHLGTSIAPLIINILQRIVDTYPNAVIYTFRLTVETNSALLNDSRTYEIRKILYNRPEIDQFLVAMQYVVQPELYLQHYLQEFLKNLSLGTSTAVDMLLTKVYPNSRGNRQDPRPGNIFHDILKYKNEIKAWEKKKPEEIKQRVVQLIGHVKELLFKRNDRLNLHDYSPWLYNFCEKDIEIPGQYTGNRKPMPQYHTKIMKLEPKVKVMQSLRKPIRITMVGNDAKEYHFLAKFGEDLRQDQRLQQLFTIMNKTLYTNAACKQRQLSIDTYQVIPLSTMVGLIQWVDNTRSLQDLIHFTLPEKKSNQYNSIVKDYDEWMRRAAASSKKRYEGYKTAVIKYSAPTVTAKMNEFISKTEWDSLRETFVTLCPSVESFVTMRRNFITTYASMCIAHWILGIGDRHLGNVLVTLSSGRCLGIDFGLAFDAGIDLTVPELMPFRLTSQILGLLKPFTEKDLLRAVMIHTLGALRNEQGPILSCMDVFVHEPINWTEHVNKILRKNEEDTSDVKWLPMKKIKAVTKKLNGIKPSLIVLEQLKDHHDDNYYRRYYDIVTGNDDMKRSRAKMKNDSLSPEEQVDCLLDQATDLNILGRSYVGWKPWL